jgi:predicted MPP superfamily phosphohydrolase
MFTRIAILVGVSLLIDFINLIALRQLTYRIRESLLAKIIIQSYWLLSVFLGIYFTIHFFITGYPGLDYVKYRSFFDLFGVYALIYFPRIVFLHFVILQFLFFQIKRLLNPGKLYMVKRNKPRNFIFLKVGLLFIALSFLIVLYGLIWGKTAYVVKQQIIYSEDLPKGFDGFRILQISDMHLGSFRHTQDVEKGLQLAKAQKADLIVFTGDMVNNVSAEMDPYIQQLAQLKAPFGVYAILGNHDMGDYVKWQVESMKYNEIQNLINKEKTAGFTLLLNENRLIYRNGDSIALMGVENWGNPPFKQYGNLSNALSGVEKVPFKILLSHDPSHFKAEIYRKTDIQLTLSGHTHGMQVGVDIFGFQWSPIKYLYPQWKGLYQFDNQYLYVNPGFGFIGLPARIGIRPEITIIKLKTKPKK